MSVASVEICGLRGFATAQTLRVAQPSGANASGLTILVGPNNGGKSTIVEALRALATRTSLSFTEGRRNTQAGDKVLIRARRTDGTTHEVRTVDTGGSETTRVPEQQFEPTTYVLPSRRYFNPYFGRGHQDRQTYATSMEFPQSRGQALNQFSGRLFRVLEERKAFDEVLCQVLQPVPDWTIDQSDGGQYYLKFNAGGQYHTSDGLGEGIVSLFFVVDALYDSTPGELIVVDEPELSLHPALQRRLATLLAEYSRDRQVIYATHSPYFVDFQHVVNGAEVARVHKLSNASVISQLQRATADRVGGFLGNLNNPHILGLDAREVFFKEDGVVLVEGQEDVVFYSRLLQDLGWFDPERFFGWGAGGADNIPIIAALLRDLGFTKVVGLLDMNRRGLIPALEVEFPEYRFWAIPADNVRTKPAVAARGVVHGLLDEHDRVRPEFDGALRRVFAAIGQYLD